MSVWSLCIAETGAFVGRTVSCSLEDLQKHTPAGMVAVQGVHDHLCRRWNAEAGQVEPYVPEAPAADEMQTWQWNPMVERWQAVPTLAALRAERWSQIKAQRDVVEFGGFTWDGSTFDSDRESQARIMGAVQMAVLAAAAGQPFSIAWTLADNTVRTLSGADMVAVGLALGEHVATAHAIGRALRDQIEAAQSAEELATINWPE